MRSDVRLKCEQKLAIIDLRAFLSQYSAFLEIEGRLIGKCPFHPDERGSLVITPESNSFRCVSRKCNRHGTVLELVAALEQAPMDVVCSKVLAWLGPQRPFRQATLGTFDPSTAGGFLKSLPQFHQTQLRTLRECELRYWTQYVQHTDTFRQDARSIMGSRIHAALKHFYDLPIQERTEDRLFGISSDIWGDLQGNDEGREREVDAARVALQHAYDMNADRRPVRTETEVEKSVGVPFEAPRYRLTSQVDRVDWYGDEDYCLVDYKWSARAYTPKGATERAQTVLYYLTWTANMGGIAPRQISYQFLASGQQLDVDLSQTALGSAVAHIAETIGRADSLRQTSVPPSASRNEYCFNCTLLGTCPATKGRV